MRSERHKGAPRPLDQAGLERLGLFYVGRYATTQAKLRTYLTRKVRERGWKDAAAPAVDAIVERFVELGYIDDEAFALARGEALQRRGFGARRIGVTLRSAGIAGDAADAVREQLEDGAFAAALRFARRRKIGPYAAAPADRAAQQKAFAAMMRAGHPGEIVRKVLGATLEELQEFDEP